MKKKITSLLLVGVATAMIAGCGSKTENEALTPAPTEMATETPVPTEGAKAEATETPAPTEEAKAEATETPAPTEEAKAEATETPAPTEEAKAEATETPAPTEEAKAEATETPAPTEEVKQEEAAQTIVTLGNYKGINLHEVTSESIDAEIKEMLTYFTEFVAVDRVAAEGDTVNINYVGKIDGEAFEGGTDDSEEGYNLTLGSHMFIEGFEEGLIGVKAGEVRDLTLNFPENYGNPELDGKEAVFTVTVNEVMESVEAELTDAFVAQNFGMNSVDAYVKWLREIRNKESFRIQVKEKLLPACTIENYPENEMNQERQAMTEYYEMYAAYYGMDFESFVIYMGGFSSVEEFNEYCEEYAKSAVKERLVLAEIFKKEDLTLSEDEYRNRAWEYAQEYGYPDVESFEQENGIENIEKVVIMDFVLDYIISQANIVAAE